MTYDQGQVPITPGQQQIYYPPQQYVPVQPTPAKRSKGRYGTGTVLALVVISLLIGCGAGAGIVAVGSGGVQNPLTGTGVNPGVPATTEPASSPNGIKGDGTYLVPSEVKPGTYRATVPQDSALCFWARLRDTTGNPNSTIAIDDGTAGTTMTVTIAATDKAFSTRGCGGWKKV